MRRAGLSVGGIWNTGVRGKPRLEPVPEFPGFDSVLKNLVCDGGASPINIRRAGVRGGSGTKEGLDERPDWSLAGLPASVDPIIGVLGKLDDGKVGDGDMNSLGTDGFRGWGFLSGDVPTNRSDVREAGDDGSTRSRQSATRPRESRLDLDISLDSFKVVSAAWGASTEDCFSGNSSDVVSCC